jgi:hypothetical protein
LSLAIPTCLTADVTPTAVASCFAAAAALDEGHRALNDGSKTVTPDPLPKEISRHHRRVAKGDGDPTVMLIEPDLVLAPPTRAELLRKRFRLPVQGQEVSITIGMAEDVLEMPEPAQQPAKNGRVPAAMQAKVDSLMRGIDGFCDTHLNGEYRQLI